MQPSAKVELEALGDQIAEMAAHIDAAMHRLLTAIREFDQANGWYAQGALSCAHWLTWRIGWDLRTSRERLRVARKFRTNSRGTGRRLPRHHLPSTLPRNRARCILCGAPILPEPPMEIASR